MARSDDEAQPTAGPSSAPSADPSHPPVDVLVDPNQPPGSRFRKRLLNRPRVTIAAGILAGVAAVTILVVLFGDVLLRSFWAWFGVILLGICGVAVVGLALIMRDEQRARRSGRDDRDAS